MGLKQLQRCGLVWFFVWDVLEDALMKLDIKSEKENEIMTLRLLTCRDSIINGTGGNRNRKMFGWKMSSVSDVLKM